MFLNKHNDDKRIMKSVTPQEIAHYAGIMLNLNDSKIKFSL